MINFKTKNAWVLLPLLLPVVQSGFAAAPDGVVELKVTGKITPASCTLVLGSDASIAGDIKYSPQAIGSAVAQVLANESSEQGGLGEKTLPSAVTVNCDGPTLIGVNTTDNRSTTISPSVSNVNVYDNTGKNIGGTTLRMLGLGTDSKNVPIGAYSGTFINLKVDGAEARFSTCMDETVHTGATIEQGGALVVGACAGGQSHQILNLTDNKNLTGRTFVWDYKIDPVVTPRNLDPNGWSLDGSVTVQINYL